MKISLTIDGLPGTDATSIADVLTAIADAVSDRGYTDGEPERLAPCQIGTEHGCRPKFTISAGRPQS